MDFDNDSQFLVLGRCSAKNDLYQCWYWIGRNYAKEWLNSYDIIGLPHYSNYLFNLKRLKQFRAYIKRYFNPRVIDRATIHSLSLVDARVKAGQNIENNMK